MKVCISKILSLQRVNKTFFLFLYYIFKLWCVFHTLKIQHEKRKKIQPSDYS